MLKRLGHLFGLAGCRRLRRAAATAAAAAAAAPAAAPAAATHTEVILSPMAYLKWPHKLVCGTQQGKGVRTGPRHPNASVTLIDDDPGCAACCLFDVESDPNEDVDLAKTLPHVVRSLNASWLKSMQERPYFQTDDTPGYTNCTTVAAYVAAHRGFGGPVCYRKYV